MTSKHPQRMAATVLLGVGLLAGALAHGLIQGGHPVKTLPEPKLNGRISVEETIARRRSVREFVNIRLNDQELSQLLWAAQGITDRANNFRAAPSAGATYPLETYVALAEGLFHYLPEKHALELLKSNDERRALAEAALNQRWMESAAAIFIFTSVSARTTQRYGQRGIMYIHMEAGHDARRRLR